MIFVVITLLLCVVGSVNSMVCPSHPVNVNEFKIVGSVLNPPVYVPGNRSNVLLTTNTQKLWRSMDSGKSWAPADDISQGVLQILPAGGLNVVVTGFGSFIMTSTTGGTTFQYRSTPEYMTSYKFHPAHPDWILALSSSMGLYLSQDFAVSWVLIRKAVWDYDWHGLSDDEKMIVAWERIHKENYPKDWSSQVVKTATFFRTEPTVLETFVVGFLTYGGHLFIAKEKGDTYSLMSSEDVGESFHPIQFPLALQENGYIILDVSEPSTFIGVVTASSNWVDVFASDARFTSFSQSLRFNPYRRDMHADFRPVHGITGIYLANQYAHVTQDELMVGFDKVTMITRDLGGKWEKLKVPANQQCSDAVCSLNLVDAEYGAWVTADDAPGIMLGTGSVGSFLVDTEEYLGAYVSRDAGMTWEFIRKGRHIYSIGNRGAVFLMSESAKMLDTFSYSLNEGKDWIACQFTSNKVSIVAIHTDPSVKSKVFVLYGNNADENYIYSADFSTVYDRECKGMDTAGATDSDYEIWKPSDFGVDECLLGRRVQFVRRKREALCFNTEPLTPQPTILANCSCTEEDYECDYCFVRNQDGLCVPDAVDTGCIDYDTKVQPSPCRSVWYESLGYRRVPGDTCDSTSGVDHMPIQRICVDVPSTPSPMSPADASSDWTQSSRKTGIIVFFFLFSVLFVGAALFWWLSGKNDMIRNLVTTFVPEKYLPDFKPDEVQYSQLNMNPDAPPPPTQKELADSGSDDDEKPLNDHSDTSLAITEDVSFNPRGLK